MISTVVAIAVSLISATAAIIGTVIGWAGHARKTKKEYADRAASEERLRTDVSYIVRSVDDIKLEQRQLTKKVEEYSERLIRVEECAKSAHKRIDRLEGVK
ncbi:MAG TPA: hypothetical protein PLZ84_01295 [Clostridia bacterium]|nr:hypothetical protein [Clostridia bacterium]